MMSLSGLIEQLHLPKVAVLAAVLEAYKVPWVSAQTVEDRLVVEAEALALYERLTSEQLAPTGVTAFDHLNARDVEANYHLHEHLVRANSSILSKLMELYVTRHNNQQILIGELVGQIRRIKQKHAVLGLWNNNKARHFVAEQFLNTEALASNYIAADPCEIHTGQGLLTLPVQLRERVTINTIAVGSGSNGTPGSSDLEVDTTNQDLNALIGRGTGWFEYERLDTGPVRLALNIGLLSPQIVNNISIVPADTGATTSFEIEDIVFTTSTKESTSIRDLFPSSYGEEFFNVPVATVGGGWECSFLPVEAVAVTVTLIQTQGQPIETASPDGGTAIRERFAIPLKSVGLYRNQYRPTGGINSVTLPIRKTLYAVEPVVKVSPDNTSFYDLLLEVSFDGGATWKLAGTDETTQINLVNANDRAFIWRLSMSRVDSAFSTLTSFFSTTESKGDVRSVLKTVSRFNSPAVVALTSQPKDAGVYVIQPKVGRRGKKHKSFKVGATSSGTSKLRLPFNVLRAGVDPAELRLFVGGVEYLRKQPGESVSALEWSFSDDHDEVVLASDLPAGTQVDVVLDDELMLFEEREDGYYHGAALPFDPDKSNIEISCLAREPARGTVLLQRGHVINYLGHENLLSGTLQITSANGDDYVEVTSRDSVYDAADLDYYVDYKNGVLYLATAVGDDNVRVSFDYQPTQILDQESFSVAYVDGKPWGVRVNKDALEAATIQEAVDEANVAVLNPITKAYEVRPEVIPLGSSTKKQLSYDYLIKGTFTAPVDLLVNELVPEEVDYVDGITEFLGLTQTTDEQTVETAANGSGVASFSLGARSLWYPDLGVTFSNTSVFSNLVGSAASVTSGSVGDYFVDTSGVVYVQVGVGDFLPAGIRLSYYFRDEAFDPSNKFSVDYKNGVLYTHDALNDEAVVKYKTASYTLSYDLAREVKDFQYNSASNSVQVRTEGLDPINNLVKVVWEEQPVAQVSPTLQQYFSPLVSLVGWRFS